MPVFTRASSRGESNRQQDSALSSGNKIHTLSANIQTEPPSNNQTTPNQLSLRIQDSEDEAEAEADETVEEQGQGQLHKYIRWLWPIAITYAMYWSWQRCCGQDRHMHLCVHYASECAIQVLQGNRIIFEHRPAMQMEGPDYVGDSCLLGVYTPWQDNRTKDSTRTETAKQYTQYTMNTSFIPETVVISSIPDHKNEKTKSATKLSTSKQQAKPHNSTTLADTSPTHINPQLQLALSIQSLTTTIHHAVFPLPYLTTLAAALNNHPRAIELHSHTPFLSSGPRIVTSPLNLTLIPPHHITRQLLSLAAELPVASTEEEHTALLLEYDHLHTLISLLATNEVWEDLVFDSSALTTLLKDMASDFLWLDITARSWTASIDLTLVDLIKLLSSPTHTEEPTSIPAKPKAKSRAHTSALLSKVDFLLASTKAHIRHFRARHSALLSKKAAVETQVSAFIKHMSMSADSSVGFQEAYVSAFYTEWMLDQLQQGKEGWGSGFWQMATKERFDEVQEAAKVVDDLEVRWRLVMREVEVLRAVVIVHRRESWVWRVWGWVKVS